ncbi:TPA: hypothetical protein N0F65_001257 [Lagenidium giganteum]|uniref:Pectin acetylesterase n=1 Tax=Lagenidium giganteum TaxID=4803 RepID=A0AAV2YUU7_9STRA|nr:TPA: hypothetical protein N0F65_001257 [Lagenidium giganteum]
MLRQTARVHALPDASVPAPSRALVKLARTSTAPPPAQPSISPTSRQTMVSFRVSLLALLGALAATDAANQECRYEGGSNCSLDSLPAVAKTDSVLIYPGGKTRCAFDDYVEPTTNFTTNATFFFQFMPSVVKSSKLMIYFQAGGACIDDTTCDYNLLCSMPQAIFSTVAKAADGGIFNRTHEDNPFMDWNIVHVPYCTGDLHLGNDVRSMPESPYAQFLGKPSCLGHNMTIHQVGYENAMAAFDWAKANFPSPSELILGGSSAGSMAAQLYSAHVAKTWETQAKKIPYAVLGDSYVGVFPDKSVATILKYYGMCNHTIFPEELRSECHQNNLTVSKVISHMVKHTQTETWLFVNSKQDMVQRLFYQIVHDGVAGYPFPNLISGDDFFAKAQEMIDTYKSLSSQVTSYVVEGLAHIFVADERLYSTVDTTNSSLVSYIKNWTENVMSSPATADQQNKTADGSKAGSKAGRPATSSAPARKFQAIIGATALAALLVTFA